MTTQNLIFSHASTSLTGVAHRLTKSDDLSLYNRLHSIAYDADYVREVSNKLSLPVVANQRCGAWYVAPDIEGKLHNHTAEASSTALDGSGKPIYCYFKSTDGHHGNWGFNLRRLNLSVLELIGQEKGCVIVDSTRRGKHFPDALSKTIPIWCAVINRLLFPELPEFHALRAPGSIISSAEISQIDALLPGFVVQAKKLGLDLTVLAGKVKRPLRPMWISRSLSLPDPVIEQDVVLKDDAAYPVYLCMASLFCPTPQASQNLRSMWADNENTFVSINDVLPPRQPFIYVQGAGDDAESWSLGLKPEQFWASAQTILWTAEEDITEIIEEVNESEGIEQATETNGKSSGLEFVVSKQLYVERFVTEYEEIRWLDQGNELLLIHIAPRHQRPPESIEVSMPGRWCHLVCRGGKNGSKDLRTQLDKLRTFLQTRRTDYDEEKPSTMPQKPSRSERPLMLISCETGNDLSIGVALFVLCLYGNENWDIVIPASTGIVSEQLVRKVVNKDTIKSTLARIMSCKAMANPSRATLTAVNEALMGHRYK